MDTKYFMAFVGFGAGKGLDIIWCLFSSFVYAYADPNNGPNMAGMINDFGMVLSVLIGAFVLGLLGFFTQKALGSLFVSRSHTKK